ncbi:MAG: hypothetical protein HYZ86_04445 [Candidatus Omnitrophica bacterium]|nr:hypothetical protein [Candidatus Omnitrophota bacterium]
MVKPSVLKAYALIACLVVTSISLSACEPLRKKFTRQKKKDAFAQQDFIPVLEPQEYPAAEKDPVQNYKQHYALIKVWYRDMWRALEERGSDKQQRYLIKTIYGHIDEMRKLVGPQQQQKLDDLAKVLSYYDSALGVPAPMRNVSRIRSDLRAFDRMLRNKLRADRIKGSFIPVP